MCPDPSALYGPAEEDSPQILISSESATVDINQAHKMCDSHSEHQSETVTLVRCHDVQLGLVLCMQLQEA